MQTAQDLFANEASLRDGHAITTWCKQRCMFWYILLTSLLPTKAARNRMWQSAGAECHTAPLAACAEAANDQQEHLTFLTIQ